MSLQETRIEPDGWGSAIAETDGAQLIVAGPGTGKTQFLIERATHLITKSQVDPASLLVLTFSRRSADNLRKRIDAAVGREYAGVAASTFHSLAFRVLETYAHDALDWHELPSLLTGPEQVALVAELLATEDPANWPIGFRGMLDTVSFADEVTDFILRSQEFMLDDATLKARGEERPDWKGLAPFRRRYLDELKARHRIDYGTLQGQAVRVSGIPEIGLLLADQYRYVLVDEYQDTTPAQARFLEHLTRHHRNITAAADPYQSVYSFRGAELTNVADFPALFTDSDGSPARRLILTTSFRVPAEILTAAERVTASGDLPGAAGPVQPAAHTGVVDTFLFAQASEEAEWIANEAQRLHLRSAIPYRDMAVLVRSKRRFLPELSRALDRRSIPHDSPDTRLVDHPAVRIVFDIALAATHNESVPGTGTGSDVDRAIRRILLGPLFALSLSAERELIRTRSRTQKPWSEVLAAELPHAASLADLLAAHAWASEQSATKGFWHLWTNLEQFRSIAIDPHQPDMRTALTSLGQALAQQSTRDPTVSLIRYSRIAEQDDFEATPLLSYRADNEDRLTLTTLHQAKGLQFKVVVIADAVEGVFPDLRRSRSLLQPRLLSRQHQDHSGEAARFRLQEEMRLAYTAMTRASARVIWTATRAGIDELDRRPSRFLRAVSEDGLKIPQPHHDEGPLTYTDAEAHYRRIMTDTTASSAERLAAVSVLVDRPNPGVRAPEEFAGVRQRGRDEGLIESGFSLSPSQATSYDNCPRQYAFERRLGINQEFGKYATFGTLIHEILETAEQSALDDARPRSTLAEATTLLDALFEDYDFGGGVHKTAWKARATQLLNGMYADWIRPDARAALLEKSLELEIDGIRWRGFADRIEQKPDGTVRVVDYKTSKNLPTKDEAAVSIQLAFYLVAAQADPDVTAIGEPTEAEFWHPLTDRKTKYLALDPSRSSEVLDAMRSIAIGIESEDWTPKLGAGCKRCTIKLVCPLWPEGREAYSR